MKIYVAIVEEFKKKERHDKIKSTKKLNGFLSFTFPL
jgi:hypothetical protein